MYCCCSAEYTYCFTHSSVHLIRTPERFSKGGSIFVSLLLYVLVHTCACVCFAHTWYVYNIMYIPGTRYRLPGTYYYFSCTTSRLHCTRGAMEYYIYTQGGVYASLLLYPLSASSDKLLLSPRWLYRTTLSRTR